jgi:hypothetical protein
MKSRCRAENRALRRRSSTNGGYERDLEVLETERNAVSTYILLRTVTIHARRDEECFQLLNGNHDELPAAISGGLSTEVPSQPCIVLFL